MRKSFFAVVKQLLQAFTAFTYKQVHQSQSRTDAMQIATFYFFKIPSLSRIASFDLSALSSRCLK